MADGNAWPQYEGQLIGDKEGLGKLKEAIEIALSDGRASIDLPHAAFVGVQVVESNPSAEKNKDSTLWKVGCITVLVIAGFIFLVGFVGISSVLKDYVLEFFR